MFQTDVLSFCGYALETEFSDSKARCAYLLQFLTNKAFSKIWKIWDSIYVCICNVVLYIIKAIWCLQIKKHLCDLKNYQWRLLSACLDENRACYFFRVFFFFRSLLISGANWPVRIKTRPFSLLLKNEISAYTHKAFDFLLQVHVADDRSQAKQQNCL